MNQSRSLGKLIGEARRSGGKTLSLRSLKLEEFPNEVLKLSDLEVLDLSGNSIETVPARVLQLTSLKRFDLTDNPVKALPDIPGLLLDWSSYLKCGSQISAENIRGLHVSTGASETEPKRIHEASQLLDRMAALPNLRELVLGLSSLSIHSPLVLPPASHNLANFFDGLHRLAKLEILRVFGVLLNAVPNSIRQLKDLKLLSLGGAGLKELPDWLCELNELSDLSVHLNDLRQLPSCLSQLTRLEKLDLSYNQFAEIPLLLLNMGSLRTLRLRAFENINGFKGLLKLLPAEITQSNLSSIDVRGQPIETPPPEVVQKGIDEVKNYWRQQQEEGVDYLCEAKLIAIGEAGAGKTSLAKKIQNSSYELKSTEISTEGIEIARWSFQAAIRVGPREPKELVTRDFQVSIWDFGGQEVYHATHQFFLTHRSLYVLVVDDRKEDTDFNYWLNIVELLSDNSPVLIVQNEKQDRRRDIDVSSLRARFSNLKETYQINLATNRGLERVKEAIRQELQRLPHIGVALPRTWKKVREALERDAKLYRYRRLPRDLPIPRLQAPRGQAATEWLPSRHWHLPALSRRSRP